MPGLRDKPEQETDSVVTLRYAPSEAWVREKQYSCSHAPGRPPGKVRRVPRGLKQTSIPGVMVFETKNDGCALDWRAASITTPQTPESSKNPLGPCSQLLFALKGGLDGDCRMPKVRSAGPILLSTWLRSGWSGSG